MFLHILWNIYVENFWAVVVSIICLLLCRMRPSQACKRPRAWGLESIGKGES